MTLFDRLFRTPRGGGLSRTQEYLRQIVYGGNDGIVTTFAIVAGFAGARAEGAAEIGTLAVLVFGVANLFADGASMGLGAFLSGRSQRQLYLAERGRVLQFYGARPDEGAETLAELLTAQGVAADAARSVAGTLARYPEFAADLRLRYGLDMDGGGPAHPAAEGIVTFLAFVALGVVPLLPYLLGASTEAALPLSIASTLAALLALGTLRWRATGEAAPRAVGETVLVGAVCALVAFLAGSLVAAA